MAWTAPRTWSDPENRTAAMFNTHVRDNFIETEAAKLTAESDLLYATGANALSRLPHNTITANLVNPFYVQQAVDQSTISDAEGGEGAQSVNLRFAIAASEVWLFEMFAVFTSDATCVPTLKFTIPAGGRGFYTEDHGHFLTGGQFFQGRRFLASTAFDLTADLLAPFAVTAYVVNGINAGEVVLHFGRSELDNNDTNVILKAGSFMRALKVA